MADWDELSYDTIKLAPDQPNDSKSDLLESQAKNIFLINIFATVLWLGINVDQLITMFAVCIGVIVGIAGLIGRYGLGQKTPTRIWMYTRVLTIAGGFSAIIFALTVLKFSKINDHEDRCEHIEGECPLGIEHYKYIMIGTVQGNAALYYLYCLYTAYKYKPGSMSN